MYLDLWPPYRQSGRIGRGHLCGFTDLRAVFDRVKVGHVHAIVTGVDRQPALSTGPDHFEPSAQQLGAA